MLFKSMFGFFVVALTSQSALASELDGVWAEPTMMCASGVPGNHAAELPKQMLRFEGDQLTVFHIMPVSKGGCSNVFGPFRVETAQGRLSQPNSDAKLSILCPDGKAYSFNGLGGVIVPQSFSVGGDKAVFMHKVTGDTAFCPIGDVVVSVFKKLKQF